MKSEIKSKRLLNKIYRKNLLDYFFHKNNYVFDNGQTQEMIDIKRDVFQYIIVQLKLDVFKEGYLVFIMICIDNKVITHQFTKYFSDKHVSKEYMIYLKNLIFNLSDDEIIEQCYHQMPSFFQILKGNYSMSWKEL